MTNSQLVCIGGAYALSPYIYDTTTDTIIRMSGHRSQRRNTPKEMATVMRYEYYLKTHNE